MLKYLFTVLIIVYLLSVLFPSSVVEFLVSLLSLLSILLTITLVNKMVLKFGLAFLGLGIFMLYTSGTSPAHYLFSFGSMLNLLSLFALVPILALPIKLGNYAEAVQNIIQEKVKNSGQLYMLSSGISYFLSSFMNLAALPMTYYAIQPSIRLFSITNKPRFMSRSITHGFAMPLLWTPVTPIVGIVIEMTGVSWGAMLPILIPLSILGLLLDWATGVYLSKKYHSPSPLGRPQAYKEMAAAIDHSSQGEKTSKLFHLIGAVLLLNVIITFADLYLDVSFLFLVTILVIPFSFTWALLIQKGKGFLTGLKEHFDTHLLKMKDQFFIFLSAGFFISAIGISGTEQTINKWIGGLITVIGEHAFLFIVPLLPLALAFIGLHPAVALALLVEAIDFSILGISPVVFTLAMLGGAVPAFLMGPYNATLGLMSNIIDEDPYKISRWNAGFTFMYLLLLLIFISVLQLIF
ncbi:hypothetical protein ACFPU1_04650 [Thalassorhabdus alkalitolerans]|uniref:Di-and tricarboxylate transporter n=1 Tax=Thalassorhabdus alkalitolerans TaxID=2282697 RepID=A0ABW0YLL5_9BACI